MDANELRRAFTGFFEARQHIVVPSAPLIPNHPTAPMFTNSGMMQFVSYFLGEEVPPFRRATSVQKCVRAGGKHNDLDAIGRSLRHLSFFEMLGNFSFGDYFKAEAIPWAWEFLTEVLGYEPDRLWVTVHESDDEAEQIWMEAVGFPKARIQRLGKDNFWEMGETGPCGPSSEIFFDFGPDLGAEGGPAHGSETRYVEIWNLVFPQYYRQPDKSLTDLPARGIDTGAGLERNLAAMAGSPSLYDCDVLAALVQQAESVTGRRMGEGERSDVALRLLADHARTTAFLVNDGVVPSNEDRGYVLRRIIRRAVRYAHLLGVERLVMPPMIARTTEVMGDAYPELLANRDWITDLVIREEERFRGTLKAGSTILDEALEEAGGTLPGSVAFKLHDTYGFPLEVTEEVAAERGVTVDVAGFEVEMELQRSRGKKGRKGPDTEELADAYRSVLDTFGTTEFTGYEEAETKARLLEVLPREDGNVEVFLDRTPFYAESGGQVGDTGLITAGTGRFEVLDTTLAVPGLHRHLARPVDGELRPGAEVTASIDVRRRDHVRRNHTGTHLLHWALREVLGEHVRQQGSLVAPDYLRFDFSHHMGMTEDELVEVEERANAEVLANETVRAYETTKDHAAEIGAIAFFGDKYGEVVRVVEAGRRSLELCGGTHVRRVGDVGPIRINQETAIGANQRRLFATTGTATLDRMRSDTQTLARVASLLGVPPAELLDGVERQLEAVRFLRHELAHVRRQVASAGAGELAAGAVEGVVVARRDGLTRDEVKDLALAVRDQPGVKAVVLGSVPEEGGVALVASVAKGSGYNASNLLAEAARAVGGGGGKQADTAVAGGRDPSQLDRALDLARVAAGLPTGGA